MSEIRVDAVNGAIPVLRRFDGDVPPRNLLIALFKIAFKLWKILKADKFAVSIKGINYSLALPLDMSLENVLCHHEVQFS